MDLWQPDKLTSGIFNDFNNLVSVAGVEHFPTANWLNKFFAVSEYQYIAQDEEFDWQGHYYEEIIYQQQKIPSRVSNWHDFFNAFIWHQFPLTKKLLNKMHMEDIQCHGLKKRTKRRDAITLLDECGVILACSNEQMKLALRGHQWDWAFVSERKQWWRQIRPFMFGHANYEMSLDPFIGLTGKALFIDVEAAFFDLPLSEQYAFLDGKLAECITQDQLLADNRSMSPLPFLGVPGWYLENEDFKFYQNLDYFRPKRKRVANTNQQKLAE